MNAAVLSNINMHSIQTQTQNVWAIGLRLISLSFGSILRLIELKFDPGPSNRDARVTVGHRLTGDIGVSLNITALTNTSLFSGHQ